MIDFNQQQLTTTRTYRHNQRSHIMQITQEKARIIKEVEPIKELLCEVRDRLHELPRSATAARQLAVIINKLDGWKQTYEPQHEPPQKRGEFERDEIDKALKAYRRNGFFGLTAREKEAIEFFDRNYRQQQA